MLRIVGNILRGGDMSDVKVLVLIKRVGFRVGKGNRVWFWVDGWLGAGPLFILHFLGVFNKLYSVKEATSTRGYVIWELYFRRDLNQFEESENEQLLSFLFTIFICREKADARIWRPCLSGSSLHSTTCNTCHHQGP